VQIGSKFSRSKGTCCSRTTIKQCHHYHHYYQQAYKIRLAGEFAYFSETHPTMVGKVIVTSESKIPSKQGISGTTIPSINNRNSAIPVSPTPPAHPSPSIPSIVGPAISENAPSMNNNSKIDYGSLCTKLQPVLIQSCHTLVNTNGSLTSQGNHALHCVKSAILLGGDASSWAGVPLSVVLNGLSMLAPSTGCDGIVNMSDLASLGIQAL
jgi:hypothetical protein